MRAMARCRCARPACPPTARLSPYRLIAGLLLAAAGAVQAGEPTPDLLTFDRIAYELAVLDLVEYELDLAEPSTDRPTPEVAPGKVPRFNPCAHLPPDEPSGICHCPPAPPWGWCY